MPSLTLQPLVGNAIIRGISPKGQGRRIHTCSQMEGRWIQASVAGTGRGTARERLGEIHHAPVGDEEKTISVGVGNIHRRVHGMYQDGEALIYSSEGWGMVVQMTLTP